MTGAVLRAGTRTPKQLYTGMADVEHLLATSGRFEVTWGLSVEKMGLGCRDNVIQVDPDTGEVVRLRCDKESTMPPTIP